MATLLASRCGEPSPPSEKNHPKSEPGVALLGFMGMYMLLGILFLFLIVREIAQGPADSVQ
jgi:cytochrome bd-type quinol oxidase subunit 1